jgi:cytochrome P450
VPTATAAPAPGITLAVRRYLTDPAYRLTHADDLIARLPTHAPLVALPGLLVVSGFDLVRSASRDTRLAMPRPKLPATTAARCPQFVSMFADTLSFRDPDDHRRLRGILGQALAPTAVREHRTVIDAIVRRLLGAAVRSASPRRGPVGLELVSALADPLPVLVTGALLGVDPGDEAWLRRRARAMLSTLEPDDRPRGGGPITAREFAEVLALVARLLRRPRTVLAGSIRDAIRAGTISADEGTTLVVLLIMTGVDTVTAALTNTVYQLAQRGDFGGVGDGTCTPADAFAEGVRLMTPTAFAPRLVTAATEIGGHRLSPGDAVMLGYGPANRDPARFRDPGAWDPARRPSSHLSFGHGAHHCLGAALARIQAEAVLTALAARGARLDPRGEVRWRTEVGLRGPATLPLLIGAAP